MHACFCSARLDHPRDQADMPSSGSSSSASGSDSEDGQDYLEQLSRKQTLEINAAFDRAAAAGSGLASASGQPAAKRRRVDNKGKGRAAEPEPEQAAGGFLLDDDDDAGGGGGGGFLPEEPVSEPKARAAKSKSKTQAKAKSVLLDDIPSILEALELDGDDPSILSIFENASEANADGLAIVKRKKFLRVAAILIAQRDEEGGRSPSDGSKGKKVHSGGGHGRAVRMDVDEHDDSDPLVLSSDEEEDDDDPNAGEDSDPWADEDGLDGAFQPGRSASPPSTRRTTRSQQAPIDDKRLTAAQKGKGKAIASAASGKAKAGNSGKELKLSADQKKECEKMFHQFFNSSDRSQNRAISMADIRYVATLLNEKISDADVRSSHSGTRGMIEADHLLFSDLTGRGDAGIRIQHAGQDCQLGSLLKDHGRCQSSVA